MANRSYGQFCGLALALDHIGGRWTLLIVRELLPGPARFGELHEALPGIATNLLTARLRDLEECGLVERLPIDGEAGGYRLSEAGQALGPAIREMALWGIRFMGDADFQRPANPRSMVLGMGVLATAVSIAGLEARVHLIVDGHDVAVRLDGVEADFALGRPDDAEVRIESDYEPLAGLVKGVADADDLIGRGAISVDGDPRAADAFFALLGRIRDALNRAATEERPPTHSAGARSAAPGPR